MRTAFSVTVAILAAVLGSTSAAGAPPPLSLADAVERALAANPTLAAARLGLGAARAGIDLAAAAALAAAHRSGSKELRVDDPWPDLVFIKSNEVHVIALQA